MSARISYVSLVRAAISRLNSEGQSIVTQEQLFEILSVLPEEKRRVYEAVRQLKRRGELTPEGKGFRYQPEAAPETFSDQIYRVIRAYQGGFTVENIATLAEINIGRVRNVIMALADSGYLKEAGCKSRSKIWLATQLCRETPTPPKLNYSQGSFMAERRAVARLVDIFMTASDLSGSRTAENIREQLNVLSRRFGKTKTNKHPSEERDVIGKG